MMMHRVLTVIKAVMKFKSRRVTREPMSAERRSDVEEFLALGRNREVVSDKLKIG
jgi:hypothetical protein